MSVEGVHWLYHGPDASAPLFRLGRAGDVVVAEWPGIAVLRADVAGTWSELTKMGETSAHVSEHLDEHVRALMRHLRGEISLHASSVAQGQAAVAFTGSSGDGKSTIAAQLCMNGTMTMLADDTTSLRFAPGAIEVVPTESNHWLRPDIARALIGTSDDHGVKIALRAPRSAREPVRLAAVVALVFDDGVQSPTLRPTKGAKAFAGLSLSTFRFALDESRVLRTELDHLARIVNEIPMFELRRPRKPESIDTSLAAASALIRSLG